MNIVALGLMCWQLYAQMACKRLFDVTMALGALLVLSPILALVALWIRLDSPGNVIFSQYRVGKTGQLFKMYKFRSMYTDAEQRQVELMANNEMQDGVLFKMKHDPRITRSGRFLRKFSIDELPQLWNVLKGDMALVGPRPPLPSEVAHYTAYDYQRLTVTPGLTCLWQISGRSELSFAQQVELDLAYIARQSFWFDLVLLFKTLPAVLKAKGAY